MTLALASIGIIYCLFIALVSYLLQQYYASPLKDFRGPFAARFTNPWRFFDVAAGRAEVTQIALHQRYGQAVRPGPNMISLSDPSLIRTIYSTKGDFVKVSVTGRCFEGKGLVDRKLTGNRATSTT